MERLPDGALDLLDRAVDAGGPLLWLTGAGISAESGIPTFRGKEGYWQVGSRNYHPQELATQAAFRVLPDLVWSWYLYRRSVCRAAEPNEAHRALAALEPPVRDRFLLITQNVDGLHIRAGNSRERVYEIHGDLELMRCAAECATDVHPVPEAVDARWERGRQVGDAERELLVCPRCGGPARPHVLWFDEFYDEPRFRFESSLRAASRAALLVVVGTAGATNLPLQVAAQVARREVPLFAINLEPSPFTELADELASGCVLWGRAGEWVPSLCEALTERLAS